MLYKFDVIKELINHGKSYAPDTLIDPSTSPELRNYGLGLVTSHIEQLSLVDVINNPCPIFGSEGGMWIAYQLTEFGRSLIGDDEKIREVIKIFSAADPTEIKKSILSLIDECKTKQIQKNIRQQFFRTLEEIAECFDRECFIAAISLSGKILEFVLKEILVRNQVIFDDKLMLKGLVDLVKREVKSEFIDPGLENIADLIRKSRNLAIHANEEIPIPSRDQTIMVIYALRDVVRKNLSHLPNES